MFGKLDIIVMFAEPVRNALRVDSHLKLLFGISFGQPDPDGLSAKLRIDRAPLNESVTFHR